MNPSAASTIFAPLPDDAAARSALASILDPEFGVSIVDLGLIYDVNLAEDRIAVAMTLTSPHCPAGDVIMDGVRAALSAIAGGRPVEVELVWTPPWTPARLSQEARTQLGWRETEET